MLNKLLVSTALMCICLSACGGSPTDTGSSKASVGSASNPSGSIYYGTEDNSGPCGSASYKLVFTNGNPHLVDVSAFCNPFPTVDEGDPAYDKGDPWIGYRPKNNVNVLPQAVTTGQQR